MRASWRRVVGSEVSYTVIWVLGALGVWCAADVVITQLLAGTLLETDTPVEPWQIGLIVLLGLLLLVFTLGVARFGSYTAAALFSGAVVVVNVFQVVAAVAWASGATTGAAAMDGWGLAERASQIGSMALALLVTWVIGSRIRSAGGPSRDAGES